MPSETSATRRPSKALSTLRSSSSEYTFTGMSVAPPRKFSLASADRAMDVTPSASAAIKLRM